MRFLDQNQVCIPHQNCRYSRYPRRMRARLQFRGVDLKGCNVLKRVFKCVFWIKIKCVFRIKTADTRDTRDVVDL